MSDRSLTRVVLWLVVLAANLAQACAHAWHHNALWMGIGVFGVIGSACGFAVAVVRLDAGLQAVAS